jgi:hypothetical protein
LYAGERRPDVKPKTGVETKRAIVKRGLHQPDSGCALYDGAIHYSLHELTADAPILRARVDGDGADTEDHRSLIEAIAADDPAFGLCHDTIETGT